MDDFSGLLTRDFGFKPQGKPAPPRNSPAASDFDLKFDFNRSSSSSSQTRTNPSPAIDDRGGGRGGAAADGLLFNDVFGGPPKYAAFDYNDVFKDQKVPKSSSVPVYDKPVFDEDIFEGIPGIKSASTMSSTQYEDVLASISGSSPRKPTKQDSSAFDDLLGNLGRKDGDAKKMGGARNEKKDYSNFDDLIPNFGRSNSPGSKRWTPEVKKSQQSNHDDTKVSSNSIEDPFESLESKSNPAVSSSGIFADPLEDIDRGSGSRHRKTEQASVQGGASGDLDPLDSLGKSMPGINGRRMDTTPMRTESINGKQSPEKNSESQWRKRGTDDILGSHQLLVDSPSMSVGRRANPYEANSMANTTLNSGGKFDSSNDVWLTVSEIPLFTQATRAPPPSRPPPPRPTRPKRSGSGSFASRNARKTNNGFSPLENSAYSYSPTSVHPSERTSVTSQLDGFDDFAAGRARGNANGYAEEFSIEDFVNPAAAAAAMKEAMEKAEAKFRHAREMREKEYLKSSRSQETVQLEKDYVEKEHMETQERLDREKRQWLREEEEKEKRRLEKEQEIEREQRRIERERLEREREYARQAVQRATREARERAAAEARTKAQKAAFEKAAAEARERAEKAAVQRAQSEARERAAAAARAAAARERANAEARDIATRETRASAERAAVQRAAAEARERAASQARENQQKDENDLESILNRGSRSSSSPRPRANFTDPLFDTQNQRVPPDSARTSYGASSSMHKASSATSFADELGSIFRQAAAPPSGENREIDGETEERRRIRLDREQRTKERAAKALAEKNERDLQAQREQAEKHRIAETLEIEIKRWAAGKEGNLRALLSTLQYVLWPECGWQPVSLTDLMTAAMVKKVYRKATLCIHPDKVQQKGANLQQKYIAEKVFDLLKEAWNKFNSEELF